MREEHLYCTTCPRECALTVTVDDEGHVSEVRGNSCPRGKTFGTQEVTCPVRVLASTMRLAYEAFDDPSLSSDVERLVPVRSRSAIPLTRQMAAMEQIRRSSAQPPVHMGDVLIPDIAGTGVDIVASCDA